MSEALCSIATPLGLIAVAGRAPMVHLVAGDFQPGLPTGMSVLACHAVLIRFGQLRPGCPASVEVRLQGSAQVLSGAETGQGLEAMVWRGSGHVLAVGTEDDDLFCCRTGATATAAQFEYQSDGLSMAFHPPANCNEVSVHLVLAWNPDPEPWPESCWYAVDQRHEHIASLVAA